MSLNHLVRLITFFRIIRSRTVRFLATLTIEHSLSLSWLKRTFLKRRFKDLSEWSSTTVQPYLMVIKGEKLWKSFPLDSPGLRHLAQLYQYRMSHWIGKYFLFGQNLVAFSKITKWLDDWWLRSTFICSVLRCKKWSWFVSY